MYLTTEQCREANREIMSIMEELLNKYVDLVPPEYRNENYVRLSKFVTMKWFVAVCQASGADVDQCMDLAYSTIRILYGLEGEN